MTNKENHHNFSITETLNIVVFYHIDTLSYSLLATT